MGEFVAVPIETNEAELADLAVDRFIEEMESKGFVGFEPSEAGTETILIGALAAVASTVAQIASVVPPAIFREYGTQLVKLAFNEGTQATVLSKWTITTSEGIQTIPEGTTLELGGFAWYVAKAVEVPAKTTSATKVQLIASERGTEQNSLSGVVEQVNPLSFVTEVQTEGESSGGTNQETDEAYLNRLAAALALQAPRPITAGNYAEFVLQEPTTVAVVGRATSIDGYREATNKFEGTIKAGELTEIQEVTSFTGITKGSELKDEAGEILPGTTVVSFNSGTKKIVMSQAATALHAKEKMEAIGEYEVPRYVTTFVTNAKGEALSGATMTKIEEYLQTFRELNFKAIVEKPSFNKIFIKTKVKVLPNYEATTVKANIETAVKTLLSPERWGNTLVATTGVNWTNYVVKGGVGERLFGIIRYNQVLETIGAVPGVGYVFASGEGLEMGRASSTGTVDLSMAGPAPLPKLEEIHVETA